MSREVRNSIIVNGSFLAIYFALAAYLFYTVATAWPAVGSFVQLPFILLFPGIVIRLYKLIHLLVKREPFRQKVIKWIGFRIVCVAAGILIAIGVIHLSNTMAMQLFTTEFAPVVQSLRSNHADPCRLSTLFQDFPSVEEYTASAMLKAGSSSRKPYMRKIMFNEERSMLVFSGGSADIDGSTIYYDSSADRWHIFHNDNAEARQGFEALSGKASVCEIQ